jgi:gliding motility-associated protein GldM
MASGKLSPRQKMINMMYLVLTAMLALNVSKDILNALTDLNNSLSQTVATVEGKNADVYQAFVAAATENPEKAGKWKDRAFEVKEKSDALFNTIATMKEEIVDESGGIDEETGAPKRLDATEDPANYMINQENGEKLKQQIEAYKAAMINLSGDNPAIKEEINDYFDTSPVSNGEKTEPWVNAKFEHYPLGAILPFLTDLQAKVRNSESDVISLLRSNISASDLKFTDVKAVVVPKSSYVTQGGEYEAEVFLAAYDATQEPTIIVNEEPIAAENIENGRGKISFPATGVGEKKWGGKIIIKQIGSPEKTYEIPEQTYTVAPQSVVISPTKMNVLYRGVDNPLEIGVPGVDPAKIRVSGPGISGSNGSYTADITKVKGKEVTINVSVVEEDEEGKTNTRPAGSKKFRIKGLPPAEGTIYKRNTGLFSKSAIANAPVEASFVDFAFDLPLQVISFEVAIPGFPPERVKGSRMPSSVRQKIERLKPGATISIRNIKARGPKNLRVNRVGNISVDVN